MANKKTVVKIVEVKKEKQYRKNKSLSEKINDAEDRADQLDAAGMIHSAGRERDRANMYRRQLGMKPAEYGGKQK